MLVFTFSSLSGRERMWACSLVIWETVLFCSRKTVCRVTKVTDGTNYLDNGVDAAEKYAASRLIPADAPGLKLLPSQHHSGFSRLLSITVPECCVYSLNWRPLGKLHLLYLIPWLSEITILCFPPFLCSITKRYVTDSHCNSSLLNLSVNFEIPGKNGWDKIGMTCMWRSLKVGAPFEFCCTVLPTGSQLGAIVSLGRVGRVWIFPWENLAPHGIRLPGILQFIRNSPSTVLLWGKGRKTCTLRALSLFDWLELSRDSRLLTLLGCIDQELSFHSNPA